MMAAGIKFSIFSSPHLRIFAPIYCIESNNPCNHPFYVAFWPPPLSGPGHHLWMDPWFLPPLPSCFVACRPTELRSQTTIPSRLHSLRSPALFFHIVCPLSLPRLALSPMKKAAHFLHCSVPSLSLTALAASTMIVWKKVWGKMHNLVIYYLLHVTVWVQQHSVCVPFLQTSQRSISPSHYFISIEERDILGLVLLRLSVRMPPIH